jgi:hypothetical protein
MTTATSSPATASSFSLKQAVARQPRSALGVLAFALTWPNLFASATPGDLIFWRHAAVLSAAAALVIIAFGPARLSHRPAAERQFVVES